MRYYSATRASQVNRLRFTWKTFILYVIIKIRFWCFTTNEGLPCLPDYPYTDTNFRFFPASGRLAQRIRLASTGARAMAVGWLPRSGSRQTTWLIPSSEALSANSKIWKLVGTDTITRYCESVSQSSVISGCFWAKEKPA